MIRNLNSASTGSTGAPSTEKINASNTSSLNDLERLERGSASDGSSVDNFMKKGSNSNSNNSLNKGGAFHAITIDGTDVSSSSEESISTTMNNE